MTMMSKAVKIPEFVKEDIFSCRAGRRQAFMISKYKLLLQSDKRTQNWLNHISKELGKEITPLEIYSYLKAGFTEYKPHYCKACGKLLSFDKIAAGKVTCSMKCTKALPEVKQNASIAMKAAVEKRAENNMRKYGVRSTSQLESVKAKYRKTCQEKYGTDFVFSSKQFKEQRNKTCLEKYGNVEPFAVESIKAKAIATSHTTRMNNYYPTFLKLLAAKQIEFLSSKEDYAKEKDGLRFRCLCCRHEWTINKSQEKYGYIAQYACCPKCTNVGTSRKEHELLEFIKSFYSGKIEQNNRSILDGKELDIYIPKHQLAIEFNGSYWHSENAGTSANYHQQKTLACREKGIRLIHVFEHEWDFKRDKVKQLIRTALGQYNAKVYARKCEVKQIDSNQYSQFLDINHFQGSVNSAIRYGLFYKNTLVAVIGFGKSRFKKGEVELHRYCVKAGYHVVGGFSKLLKHSNISSFASYIDLAHFTGKGYLSIGCKEISISKPNYIYTKNTKVLTRYQAQKHKLHSILGAKYDACLSESNNMIANGWLKVYDAGNLKVEYN